MRILKLIYENSPILGNSTIDISNSNNLGYKKIVLVGENGSGKTTILNDLYRFLNIGGLYFKQINYVNDENKELRLLAKDNSKETGFHHIMSENTRYVTGSTNNNDPLKIKENDLDIRRHGVIYSRAQADFSTTEITAVGSSDINTINEDESCFDFTQLKQLLVDLNVQDSESFFSMHSANTPIDYNTFDTQYSKLSIFKRAFNSFFDSLKFKEIKTINGHKEVYFEKAGQIISIDNLSTGEKQIVYHGANILRNLSMHKNGFVLIDEPEISMHPQWEDKILQYYTDILFSPGSEIGQLFIATHSERILASALSDPDTLVIGLKEQNSTIESNKYDSPLVLPYLSNAEISFKIFSVYTNDLQLQLYDYIQTRNHLNRIVDVDSYIANHSLYNSSIHSLTYTYNGTTYQTICSYVRNKLHHGEPNLITKEQLILSIDLMYQICGGTI